MSHTVVTLTGLRELMEKIRDAVTQPENWDTQQLEELAARFVQFCNPVFAQLEQCITLIHLGQRSEALRLADMQPPLLDLLQILSAPEYTTWRTLCEGFGFAVPPPFPEQKVSELNEAYAKGKRVAPLLRALRTMAIRRASLGDRLKILRQLNRLEPDNVAWREDLEQWEKARLDDIATGLRSAENQRNIPLLLSWVEELTSKDWVVTVPPDLVRMARVAHEQVVREQALQELRQVAERLHQAYVAFDVSTARALRAQWETLFKLALPNKDDPVWSQAGPALQWLQAQEEKTRLEAARLKAVAKLEKALENKVSPEYLERLHDQATRAGVELPVELERRYQITLEAARQSQAQKRRLLYVLGFSVLIGPSLALAIYLWSAHVRRTVSIHISNLTELIRQGEVEKAEAYFTEVSKTFPNLLLEPKIQRLKSDLEELINLEADRKRQLALLFRELEESLTGEAALEALKKAKGLVKSQEEETELLRLEEVVRQRELEIQKNIEDKFSYELSTLELQLDKIEQGAIESSPSYLASIKQAKEHFEDLKRRAPAQFQSALAVIEVRVKKLEMQGRALEREDQALRSLADTVGKRLTYSMLLKEMGTVLADTTHAAGVEQTLKLLPEVWKKVDEWNDYAERWDAISLASLSAARVKEPLSSWQKWKEQIQMLLDESSYGKIEETLLAISRRTKGGPADESRVRQLWGESYIKDLWLIELDDGERLYCDEEPPNASTGDVTITRLVNFNFEREQITLEASRITFRGRAPHSEIANTVLRNWQALSTEPWEERFLWLLAMVITEVQRSQREPEWIVVGQCLLETLKAACQGSYPLATHWNTTLQELMRAVPSEIPNWLTSEKAAVEAGLKVRKIIFEIDEAQLRSRYDAVLRTRDELQRIRLPSLQWVGVFAIRGGQLTVLWPSNFHPQPEQPLYAMVSKTPTLAIVPLGAFKDIEKKLTTNPPPGILVGMPVFVPSYESRNPPEQL